MYRNGMFAVVPFLNDKLNEYDNLKDLDEEHRKVKALIDQEY